MTLPTIPETHHVYVGADMQSLHLYTLEQMLKLRAETVKACFKACKSRVDKLPLDSNSSDYDHEAMACAVDVMGLLI